MHAAHVIYFYGGMMNTNKKTNGRAKWEALIDEQERSGKTQKKFCIERGLVLSQFAYYRSVLKSRAIAPPRATSAITPIIIKPTRKASESSINITLPNGFRCELVAGAEVSYVKRLIEVLLSC